MIRISLFQDPQNRIIGYECAGHSGYAEEGNDIVCAAVSALSIACCNSLTNIGGQSPDIEEKDGYLRVSLPADSLTHDVQIIFGVFKQGIIDIAEAYPKYLSLIRK